MIIKLIGKKPHYSLFYLQKIKQKHNKIAGTSNIYEIEDDDSLETITTKIFTNNLFSEKRLVVVREAEKHLTSQLIELLVDNNTQETTVVLQFKTLNKSSQKQLSQLSDGEYILTIDTDKITPAQVIADLLLYGQKKSTVNRLLALAKTNELEFFNNLKKLRAVKEIELDILPSDTPALNNFLLVENLLNNPIKYAIDFYSVINDNSLQSIVGLILWQLK